MKLFRFLVPLLLAGVLPCVAQSVPPKQSSQTTKITPQVKLFQARGLPCVVAVAPGAAVPSAAMQMKLCAKSKEQEQTAMAGKNTACYSIRDYHFAVPKDSQVPKLKSYSTCEPAVRFEARNVELPGAGQAANPKR